MTKKVNPGLGQPYGRLVEQYLTQQEFYREMVKSKAYQ